MIELKNISKKYDGAISPVVENLSFSLEKAKCLALLGESGSGKTTILKMINGLIKPDSGIIKVDSKDINEYKDQDLKRKVAYYFQKGLLFPHLTVEENISLPLLAAGRNKKQAHVCALDLMNLMEMDPKLFLSRYPHELSGGQSQRISLAQSIAAHPSVLLLDEPFSGLDTKTKFSLMEKILEIKDELKKTIILVTHNEEEAKFLADEVLEIKGGAH